MNITDVGHLSDDGDHGEDKMEKGARREKKTVWAVARMYEEHFKTYATSLGISSPTTWTRATEYMLEQIHMVHELTKKEYTYIIAGDGVYMDTSKVEDYGKLAQLDFAGMNSSHRVDGAQIDSSKKKNLSDFALWKFSPSGKQRAMEWIFDGPRAGSMVVDDDFDEAIFLEESDFAIEKLDRVKKSDLSDEEYVTIGFPGRHIECSAMATAELGTSIDIHTWWVDHVSVHHTNEIAQAECSLWCSEWVRRWMHVQFLQIDGGKISKSKGHDLSIPGIIKAWYTPADLRYFYLTGHYRSFLDFTREALDAAKSSRQNLVKKLIHLWEISTAGTIWNTHWSWYEHLWTILAQDLDTVGVLQAINQWFVDGTIDASWVPDILRFDDRILKLGLRDLMRTQQEKQWAIAPTAIIQLADERLLAKQAKDRSRADTLRDEIVEAGRVVKDSPEGYTLEKI